jgi:hypothetical protein
MGYKKTSYTIPALSVEQASYVSSTTTIYSGWSTISIPAHSGTYQVVPELSTQYIQMTKQSGDTNWQVDATLQLADSGDAVRVSYGLGYAGYASYTGSADGQQFYIGRTIAYALAKCRLALTITKYGGSYGCKGKCVFDGGSLHIFTESTDPIPLDCAAEYDPQRFAIVQGGKAGQRITRLRYKLAQTLAGDMSWGGSVDGTELHQF